MNAHCTSDMSSNKKTISELKHELKVAHEQGLLEYVIDIRAIKTGRYGIIYSDPYLSVRFLSNTSDKIKSKLMYYIHKNYEHVKSIKMSSTCDVIEVYYDESQID
jgi:hypothetical protein